ncbi:phage major capsid protein [bacterium]|nr:MAG: phage major capsid protein [bacterium]
MTKEEKEALEAQKKEREQLIEDIKGLIADSTKDNVSKEDLDKKIEEINKKLEPLNKKEDNHEEVKALKDSVEKLLEASKENAAAIAAMTEEAKNGKPGKAVSFYDALIASVMEKKDIQGLLVDKNDDDGKRKSLKDYFTEKGNQASPVFKVKFPVERLARKDAVDMLESNIVQNYVSTIRLTELDPQRVGIPLTIYPHVLDWMPSKTIKRPNMSILVVYSYTDGSGTKTEGSASSQSSFLFKTTSFPAFYIATYLTLSDETLDDLEEAMEEIAITVPDKILDKIDGYVLGTAGDDSSAIAGILTANKKTDFAATWDGTIAYATTVDLFAHMKLQCEGNKYKPDAILLSPTDVTSLSSRKDQMDNSIVDRRVVYSPIGEPVAICGMRVLRSTSITANTAVVVDSKQLMLGKRKEMTMEIGYNAADLTEGQKTVVLKVRLAFGVRDKAAVIYSSAIDTDVTAITSA